MSLNIKKGNIFTTDKQTIVNTINCVGVMGAGLALECRLRYPDMHEKYKDYCDQNMIKIGSLWIYKTNNRLIMNFPTKKHWKDPSKKQYLHEGLKKFTQTYESKGIESIAFPVLGSDKGGIPQDESLNIMEQYLSRIDLDIEIYIYDPEANDDIFVELKDWLLSNNIQDISKATGIGTNYLETVTNALENPRIVQLNQLASVKGIGIKTLEKIYTVATNKEGSTEMITQKPLF